jgi:hypothetical protein
MMSVTSEPTATPGAPAFDPFDPVALEARRGAGAPCRRPGPEAAARAGARRA